MTPLSGIVLAGGRSTRMGRDKATMRLGGQRLIDRAISRLGHRPVPPGQAQGVEPALWQGDGSLVDDIVVACGEHSIAHLDVRQVHDQPMGCGPLGGLLAALGSISQERAAVVAVDMPDIDLALLKALHLGWPDARVVIPYAAGRAQPLHAIWSRAVADQLARSLSDGTRSVIDAARQLDAVVVDEDQSRELAGNPHWARNLNRPSDL